MASIPVDIPTFGKYYGTTGIKFTYPNVKAELLQSDKNQNAIPDETNLVNVVTSTSISELTLPVSLATMTTSSINPLNFQLRVVLYRNKISYKIQYIIYKWEISQ